MMSIVKKLKRIRDTLTSIENVDVFHYDAGDKTEEYIVWAENGEGTPLELDNAKEEQIITGAIDYFTKTEYSEIIDKIQKALNDAKISFSLNSVQYEPETKLIHYEWIFEI